jgi:hypothetical protein
MRHGGPHEVQVYGTAEALVLDIFGVNGSRGEEAWILDAQNPGA